MPGSIGLMVPARNNIRGSRLENTRGNHRQATSGYKKEGNLATFQSQASTPPINGVLVNNVTLNVLSKALQAKQHSGSKRAADVLTSRTVNRDDSPPVDRVTSYDRSQGRYQLRPNAGKKK